MRRHDTSMGPAPRRPIAWRLIPKSSGGTRTIVVLDPADEIAFTRAVVGLAPAIGDALGMESHANRLVGWDPCRGALYEPWTRARERWRREAHRLGGEAGSVAVTDVRACFGSIAPGVVIRRLRALGAPQTRIDQLASWLQAFEDVGVEGLPVGPAASALLADAVLTAGDDTLRSAGVGFVRWVDDVALFAPDRRTRATALWALRRTWAGLGLEINEGKTAFLDDPCEVAEWTGTTSNVPSAAAVLRDNRAT